MTLGYHVALVGLPGTGKQALATALAARVGVTVYDATAATATATGTTAAQALVDPRRGEAWWRTREAETVADILVYQPPGVLVVGPGALRDDGTCRLLQLYAQVLWLHMPVGAIGEANVVDDAGNPVFAGPARRTIVEANLARVVQVCSQLGTMVWADQAPAALLADVAARIRQRPTPAVPERPPIPVTPPPSPVPVPIPRNDSDPPAPPIPLPVWPPADAGPPDADVPTGGIVQGA